MLNLSCAAAFSLLAARIFVSGTGNYAFLLWNLFLAAVPYMMSVSFERLALKCERMPWHLGAFFLLWLFFFPNAPYIVTDFVHLPWKYVWSDNFFSDCLLIAVFSFAGMMFGMGSVFRVHHALRNVIGSVPADIAIGFAISVSGFGVYLGRFLRWNSWDAFLNPLDVLRDAVSHYGDPELFARAFALSCFFSLGIGFAYLLFVATYWALGWRKSEGDQ